MDRISYLTIQRPLPILIWFGPGSREARRLHRDRFDRQQSNAQVVERRR
jgi:hypothetical protein